MDGASVTVTVATLMESVGTVFTAGVGWVAKVAETVAAQPRRAIARSRAMVAYKAHATNHCQDWPLAATCTKKFPRLFGTGENFLRS